MIAGTIAVLEDPLDEPIESTGGSGGFTTVDVIETLEGFDDTDIQHGRVCDTIETRMDNVGVTDGGAIEVDTETRIDRVWTPWVADATDAGFVAAERTHGEEFPWTIFAARCRTSVDRVEIDVGDIVASFRDRDRAVDVWMVGANSGGAEIRYHSNARPADATRADIGVGFELPWQGTTAEGVMYRSGYVAIYSEGWGPRKFAAFVRDVVLPYAAVPEDDEGEQDTLGEGVAGE